MSKSIFGAALDALRYSDGVSLSGDVPRDANEYRDRVSGPDQGRPDWPTVSAKLAELQAAADLADIKAEARRRIVARYPEWKQANMTARSVELVNIRVDNDGWSPDEQQEADALQAAWGWVKSVRRASDTLEAIRPRPDDYADDRWWPA